ncbi:Lcl C-terminal domain-containing protein [Ideonella livida]|uniref:DUF1566 domain-containing protein n=1 Tax=Ideonella livida TaxID=2707176 RepID=A0A7C9PFE5_9BURK|nr:DUF1566 domain-containing protein [Ideonella livida]NDY90072.1 DUF1566 domain-containing protein [Ideonella livida]
MSTHSTRGPSKVSSSRGLFTVLAAAVWASCVATAQAAGVAPNSGRLTDTGITAQQCYAAGSNTLVSCRSKAAKQLNRHQDGMIGRDVDDRAGLRGRLGFYYSKIGTDGRALPVEATEWSCVKDKITGLMWDVQRGKFGTYTNWGDRRAGDASVIVASVNAAGLCGHKDWRLPTALELQSLVDYGVEAFESDQNVTIDAAFFPGTWHGPSYSSNVYWTSSPVVDFPDGAWSVDFKTGYVTGDYSRSDSFHVRLVRVSEGN